jgi:hypothetical protein
VADKRNPRRANNGLTLASAKSRTVASGDVFIPIGSDRGIIIARQKGREMVAGMGFSSTDLTLIATAI